MTAPKIAVGVLLTMEFASAWVGFASTYLRALRRPKVARWHHVYFAAMTVICVGAVGVAWWKLS